jgi:RsiW-degrading membrane proteinase PrsW (M82 family)
MPSPLLIPAVVVALGVTLFFLWWVRRIEVNHREPWRVVFTAFILGAVVTVIGGAYFESFLLLSLQGVIHTYFPIDIGLIGVLGAIFIAPVAEELMKALGIIAMRSHIDEVEDGIVYGAGVGLGFSATENMLYFAGAISTGGAIALVGTAIVRSLSSTLLHLGATGLSGYGFGLYYGRCREKARWGIYVFGAMMFHGVFNLLASLQILANSPTGQLLYGIGGLFAAVILVWALFGWLRRKLRYLDRNVLAENPKC